MVRIAVTMRTDTSLHLWEDDAALALVLAAATFVGGLADFVEFEEDYLGNAFVGVIFAGSV
jgi:hypothetical protein